MHFSFCNAVRYIELVSLSQLVAHFNYIVLIKTNCIMLSLFHLLDPNP